MTKQQIAPLQFNAAVGVVSLENGDALELVGKEPCSPRFLGLPGPPLNQGVERQGENGHQHQSLDPLCP